MPLPALPGSHTTTAAEAAGQQGNKQVWVNTATHIYYKEGSKWYGKSGRGKYTSEQDAIKEGDRPAKDGQ